MKLVFRLFVLAVIVGLFSIPFAMASNPEPATKATVSAATPSAVDDEDQPHMQAALDALKQAEQHLSEAKHDKGGHRVAALKATRDASRHVEAGMKFADKH